MEYGVKQNIVFLLLVFTSFWLCSGDPDLIDALIHFLMHR